MLRLLRLLRVFKLARSFPKLRSIVEAMLHGFSSVGWSVLLMLVSNYVFGILGVMLFRSNDKMFFGSLGSAMISIFMVNRPHPTPHTPTPHFTRYPNIRPACTSFF